MRKLVLKMSVSIDGFVGGPNGEIEWVFKSLDAETTKWEVDTLWNASVHIMGSRTYQDMAAYWPSSAEPYAPPMNEIPKVIFSRKGKLQPISEAVTTPAFQDAVRQRTAGATEDSVAAKAREWAASPVASSDLKEEIARLKSGSGKPILAHGGASFAQSLAKAGVIDEYHLLIHPIALGRGLPLFSALEKPLELTLLDVKRFPNSAVAHIYRAP